MYYVAAVFYYVCNSNRDPYDLENIFLLKSKASAKGFFFFFFFVFR